VFVEGFLRCLPSENLAGAGVECGSESVDLVRVPTREVDALREEAQLLGQRDFGVASSVMSSAVSL
jgi:hypothetical protein